MSINTGPAPENDAHPCQMTLPSQKTDLRWQRRELVGKLIFFVSGHHLALNENLACNTGTSSARHTDTSGIFFERIAHKIGQAQSKG